MSAKLVFIDDLPKKVGRPVKYATEEERKNALKSQMKKARKKWLDNRKKDPSYVPSQKVIIDELQAKIKRIEAILKF